jgi:poly-gamma-glutamate synthesis protein (capsule biosynthesis protein)
VTILGSGDVLLHPPLWAQAKADAAETGRDTYDFGPIFAAVASEVAAADVAICELETPVAAPDGPFSGWPRFDVPPQVLGTLERIGYDSCSTASNHTLDRGADGVTRTLDAMDAAGLAHTGSARTEAEASQPLIITTDSGVRVGHLAYTFGFNGLTPPAGQSWLANLIDVPEILAAARRTKEAGADIVVLSLHWGTEYDHRASATQRRQAAELLASPDIDLILGAHAHVVQPMQQIDGEWVVYGMGNQVARHANPVAASREGIMPVITFTEQGDGTFRATAARIVPTWMQLAPDLRLIDLPGALADPDLPEPRRAEYQAAMARIRGYVDALGADVSEH